MKGVKNMKKTPQEQLQDFINNHTNHNTNEIIIHETEEEHYHNLVADTLPKSKQKEYVVESEYTRIWAMINDAQFETDFQKNEVFEILFANKINEYFIDTLLTYIKANLNLSNKEIDKLYFSLRDKATKIALYNDSKAITKLQQDLDQYKIDNIEQICGFDPTKVKPLDLSKSNKNELDPDFGKED